MKNRSVTFRRFLPTLLIIPYLAYIMGMFSSYVTFFHRVSFQEQVATASQGELSSLVLSAAEFKKINWTEVEKEFEYSGKMYDVSKIEKRGTQLVIYCENDSLEDMFVDWLKSVSKSKSKGVPQIQFVEAAEKFDYTIADNENTPEGIFNCSYTSFLGELTPPPPRLS